MATLTVFTPAYNRAHTIGRTYASLCRQSCKDFEWLIIDDGSSDNTEEVVKPWLTESPFKVRYIKQANQGMHGAHNTAYANITTELNTCIDSDDWMPDDAVEKIVSFWRQWPDKTVAGIIGLDVTEQGRVIGKPFDKSGELTTLSDYYAKGGAGDKKLVYRTDVICKTPPYPLFEGERYVGLAYKYMLIDQTHKLVTLNEPLVVVEYQLDGSSYNMYNQYWRNPRGFAFFRKTEMVCAPTLKRRFMSCVHYVSSSIISRNGKFIQQSPKPVMTALATIPGLMLYALIRHKVKKGGQYKMTRQNH